MSRKTHTVHCHICPFPESGHPRNTSRMIGSREWGGLWHCPKHATSCTVCPRGSWTDSHPAEPGPYTETEHHRIPKGQPDGTPS